MREQKRTVGCRISKKKDEEIMNLINEHPYLISKTQFLQVVIQETIKNRTLTEYKNKNPIQEKTKTINCKISIQEEEEIEQYLFEHPSLESVSDFLKGAIDEFLINERKLLEEGMI